MLKTGDAVEFTDTIKSRSLPDKTATNAKGILLAIKNKLARVDFLGTFDNGDTGDPIRWVPIANLKLRKLGNV